MKERERQPSNHIHTWPMQIKHRFIPPHPFCFIATIYRTIKSLLQASNFPQRYFGSESVRSAQSYYSEISTALDYEENLRPHCVVESLIRNAWQRSRIRADFLTLVYNRWAAFPWTHRKRLGKALLSYRRIERVSNLATRSCFILKSLL